MVDNSVAYCLGRSNFKSDIVRSKDIFKTNCVLKYENLTVKVKGKKGKIKGKKGRRIKTLATKIGKRIITYIKPLKKNLSIFGLSEN